MADNIFALIEARRGTAAPLPPPVSETQRNYAEFERAKPKPVDTEKPVSTNIFADIEAKKTGIGSATAPKPAVLPKASSTVEQQRAAEISRGFSFKPVQRTLWERLADGATDMVNHFSPLAAGLRAITGAVPSIEDYQGGGDNSRAGLEARAAARVVQSERDFRDMAAGRAADDPVYRPGESWYAPGALARGGADLAGSAIGGIISDPTALVAPGKTLLTKILGQGAVGGVADLATQGLEIGQGVRDQVDPLQTAVSAGGGAALVGVANGVPALRQWWKSRGSNVDGLSDADLVTASLDGGIDGQPRTPNDLDAIIRSAGAAPEQFSSPEVAAAAAARIQAAQGAPRPNLGEATAGLSRKRAGAMLDELLAARDAEGFVPPQRTLPGDTTVIGASEGNIRSDDAGGIAGLERKRAADENVLSTAQQRVASDPVVSEILNSNVSPQTKIKTLWDRINSTRDEIRNAEIPEPRRANPYTAPTAERARTSGSSFDRMLGVEGGTNADGSFRTSPKGAVGPAQVMPATGPEAARLAGLKWDEQRYRSDPAYNTALGRAYHQEMLRRFDGDEALAAAAYNAGPGRVEYAIKKGGPLGWQQYVPRETRDYVRKVFGGTVPNAKQEPAPYRIQAPDDPQGMFTAATEVPRDINDPRAGPVMDNAAGFEDTRRPTSPTDAEMAAGKTFRTGQRGDRFTDKQTSAPFESRMRSGPSDRAFRSTADDPQGQPGFWEERARAKGDEAFKRSQADLEAEWARRRERRAAEEEARRNADEGADASQRYQRERTASADPKSAYGGKYDQRPQMAGEFWRTTDDGYVAGKDGNPVAFRSAKEAAKWAASNQMGGDFELYSYGSQDRQGNQRIVLRRREGSTYGQNKPQADEGAAPQGERVQTEFERVVPPAGRSSDPSQRSIGGEAGPQGGNPTPPAPEGPAAPYRAPRPSGGGGGAAASSGPPREQVVTPRGRQIDTQFEVRDARDLISSDDPRFDQRFQPRDRATRVGSDAQVADIASRLDPEQLHSARIASHGAPIVGPDGMVESGNGRVMAVRRAYDMHPERAAAYRKMVEERGFDTTGMERPVLVRRRLTEMTDDERAAFAREGQDDGTMKMSAEEKVKADATAIGDDVLALYRGGDVDAAGNRDFVKAWMNDVISPSERNAMMRGDGTMSNEGLTRLRSTLLAKAFDDPDIIAKIVSDPDSEIVAIGKALTDTAPAFAMLKAKIAKGELPAEFDITPNVAEAAKLVLRSRQEGKSVGDLLKQGDVFSGNVDPITEAVAGIMYRNGGFKQPRGQAGIADGLRFYTDEATKQIDVRAQGDGLFGSVEPVKPVEIAQAARERLIAKDNGGRDQQADLGLSRRVGPGGRSSEQSTYQLRGELDRIAGDGGDYGLLAGRLSGLIGDEATVSYGRHILDRGDLGWANSRDNRAGVISRSDHETILHEALHLAAIRRYGHDFANLQPGDLAKAPVRDLLDLFNDARAQYERGGLGTKLTTRPDGIGYALSSPDEFFAMALTNKSTQKFLERGSLWDRLVDGVRKMFGLEPRFKPMLDRVLKAGGEILDAAKGDIERPVDGGVNLSKGFFKSVADALVDGEGLKQDSAAFRRAIGTPSTTLKAITRPMVDLTSAVFFTNDSKIRLLAERHDSDALRRYADIWHAEAGKGSSTATTYHEAVSTEATVRSQKALETLSPFLANAGSMKRIRDLLTHPKQKQRASVAEIEAAQKLRDLLKDTLDYRRAAGEEIGEVVDGYFPRILAVDKVVKRRDEFMQIAQKLYRDIGAPDPEQAASAWFTRIFDEYAGIDGGLDFSRAGASAGLGTSSAKSREFGKLADELLRDFYEPDTFGTLAAYFTGSAKRAEHARRFGAKGAVGSNERAKWKQEHGDKTQWDVLKDEIRQDLRASSDDVEGVSNTIGSIHASNLGQMSASSPKFRSGVAMLHAWNQVGVMDRSLVTSLNELAMGFVRGGARYGVPFIMDSMNEFGRQIAKAKPSEAARWAEAVGVSTDAMVSQLLTARLGSEGGTKMSQKVLAGFYKGIGLHQFTEGTRTAAVKMGRNFVDTLAHDLQSSSARVRSRADFYLRELGVSDTDAFGRAVRDGAMKPEDMMSAKGVAAEYRTAVVRFTNQTVMMPTRAQKPTWAAHPVGSLAFSLLSYSYGFKKNVLERVGRLTLKGVKEVDPTMLQPALGMTVLAGFAALNDTFLRPALFGSSYDFENETPTDFALRVADRSGALGGLSPVVNAFRGLKYDRSLAEAASGVAVGRALQAVERVGNAAVGRNSPNTQTAERNAAAAIYDTIVEPALDATAAGRLKGVARSAAIFSTGNRRGGVLPGDKDAFTDAVGGTEE